MNALCHVTKQSRDAFGEKMGSIPQNFYLV